MNRSNLEKLFLESLPAAEKILGALARRHALQTDEADEFASWAKMRLVENDYSILAKFRGESSLATYLTVVLAMMFREYRVAEWGRWRPSSAARRAGQLAMRLESLIERDGFSVSQAGQFLRTSGETTLTDRQLAEIALQFPMRVPLRPIQFHAAPADVPAPSAADDLVVVQESLATTRAASRALTQALDMLPVEDQLIVRMHYIDAMSIADIARGLALPQKPIYRRLKRALDTLRSTLEGAGVSSDFVRELSTGPP